MLKKKKKYQTEIDDYSIIKKKKTFKSDDYEVRLIYLL